MILHAIATRDIVANLYSQPMFVPSLGMAIRSFGDECKRKEKGNNLAEHPEDYELWVIGEYDDNTGEFKSYQTPERKQLAVGANYRE